MTRHGLNIVFVIASALLLHASVALGNNRLADGNGEFASKVKQLVELFTEQLMNSQALSDVLGGEAVKSPSGKSWNVFAHGYTTRVSIYEGDSKKNSSGFKIYPDSGMGLQFRHVAAMFGEWKTVHVSKTSSVRFVWCGPRRQGRRHLYRNGFAADRSGVLGAIGHSPAG